MERYSEIENVIPSLEHYGIMCTREEDFVDGKFDYIASEEVSSLDKIPVGMVGPRYPRQLTLPLPTRESSTHTGYLTSTYTASVSELRV